MKKHSYKIILLFIFAFFADSYSQSFLYYPYGPNSVQSPYYPDSQQVFQMRAIVRNNGTASLNFRFARLVNNLTLNSETQMCYDLCYAPFVDTISLPEDKPYSISPGHQDTLFYIDFLCSLEGLNTAVVRMYNTDNPSEYVENTFTVRIGSVGITNVSSVAESYSLSQNFPNPFNPTTNINFSIKSSEVVNLKVYNSLGNVVADLVNNERLSAGSYKVNFDGSNLSSGIYFYAIRTENFVDTKRMLLVK